MDQGKVPEQVQAKAASMISSVFSTYEDRMMPRKKELLYIFEQYSTFREPQDTNWSTSFKVNKAKEIIEKILPSMTAKDPRWIVSIGNVKAFKDTPEVSKLKDAITTEQGGDIVDIDNLVMSQKQEGLQDQAEAVQDYLTYIFDRYHLMDRVELYAKNGISDGKGYAQIVYKTEKAFISKRVPLVDEETNEQMRDDDTGELMFVEEKEEVVTGEYPTIEPISWADMYYDSRFIELEDRPCHIRIKEGVRYADLLKFKSRYMNLSKIDDMVKASNDSTDASRQSFKLRMMQITGIQDFDKVAPVDENSLTLRYFWGLFSTTGEAKDERMYRIVTVNDSIVIEMKEITFIPIEEWKCFPNGKDGNATGFVEPMMGLQEELNFKKNSASEYINKSLQRQRIWSPQSGIDPETINDVIIPTSADGATALANFPEVPFGQLGADYFNEQNDFERQIQAASHTIDVSAPRSQEGLTDTATGAKIKFFESNKVVNAVVRRFERSLESLAYKLLQCAFDNMEDNIIFKKQGSEEFWHMNKEALRDAINKYKIKIEINSSSFNDINDRRDSALAWFNILQKVDEQLANSGSPRRVDFIPVLEEIGHTFEKKDPNKFLKNQQLEQTIPGQIPPPVPVGPPGRPGAAKPPERIKTPSERLNKEVVGNI